MIAKYLIIINILTFAVFGIDKRRAQLGQWRIPENTMLGLCLVGGSIGGWIGMKFFHHKTRKQIFSIGIPLMLAAQLLFFVIRMEL